MPAGISYAAGVFHTRRVFHKSAKWIYFIEKSTLSRAFFWRRHPDLNRGIRVLQTHALPLGYSALN